MVAGPARKRFDAERATLAPETAELRAAIRDFGSGKELARVLGCPPDTGARYRRGERLPNPIGLTRLMRVSKAVRDAVLRMAGLDDYSMDLEQARLLLELRDIQDRRRSADAARTSTTAGAAACEVVGPRE